jgi:hypothetical protein
VSSVDPGRSHRSFRRQRGGTVRGQHIDIDYVSKAIVGIASPVLGVVTSFQEQIEWHLRVASLLVGLLVGLLSLVAMVRKMRGR